MSSTHKGLPTVAHLDEPRLLAQFRAGHTDAAAELVRRVVDDAWLLAVVVQQRVDPAAWLTKRGLLRALTDATQGALADDTTFRAAALRAVREESLTRRLSVAEGPDLAEPGGGDEAAPAAEGADLEDEALPRDDVLRSYAQLDEPARSALLLADIVLLPDEQLGAPFGLPSDDVRATAERAAGALRERLDRRLRRDADDDGARSAQLVGVVEALREALPRPPEHLDRAVLSGWAAAASSRQLLSTDGPAAHATLLSRLATAGPGVRRGVAAAAAAVLLAGLVSLGAASPNHHDRGHGPQLAAGARPPATATHAAEPTLPPPSTAAPTAPSTPGTTAPADDALLTAASLLDGTAADRSAGSTAGGAGASVGGTSGATSGGRVSPSNVGAATPAATTPPTTAAPPATTAPPATGPAPTTTSAPAPTTTTTAPPPAPPANPLQSALQPVVQPLQNLLDTLTGQ